MCCDESEPRFSWPKKEKKENPGGKWFLMRNQSWRGRDKKSTPGSDGDSTSKGRKVGGAEFALEWGGALPCPKHRVFREVACKRCPLVPLGLIVVRPMLNVTVEPSFDFCQCKSILSLSEIRRGGHRAMGLETHNPEASSQQYDLQQFFNSVSEKHLFTNSANICQVDSEFQMLWWVIKIKYRTDRHNFCSPEADTKFSGENNFCPKPLKGSFKD